MPEWVDELIAGVEKVGEAYVAKRNAQKAKRAQDLQDKADAELLTKQYEMAKLGKLNIPSFQTATNYTPILLVAGIGVIALIAMRGK